jgi:hypothetical protein
MILMWQAPSLPAARIAAKIKEACKNHPSFGMGIIKMFQTWAFSASTLSIAGAQEHQPKWPNPESPARVLQRVGDWTGPDSCFVF